MVDVPIIKFLSKKVDQFSFFRTFRDRFRESCGR
jgi:hypothetical protein